jgi:hypothetical protein
LLLAVERVVRWGAATPAYVAANDRDDGADVAAAGDDDEWLPV